MAQPISLRQRLQPRGAHHRALGPAAGMGDDGAAGQATALPSMDLFEGWGDMLSGGPTLLSEGSGEIWAVAERSEHLEVDRWARICVRNTKPA